MSDTNASKPISLLEFERRDDPSTAVVRVFADRRSPHPIHPFMTGKFAEHLGTNINNGMLAQILRNPTFANEEFQTGRSSPDGRVLLHSDPDTIAGILRRRAADLEWPEPAREEAVAAYRSGVAAGWIWEGSPDRVRASPDTGPHDGRAQRIEVRDAGDGIAQWISLPLHRIRRYEFTLVARSSGFSTVTVALTRDGEASSAAAAEVTGIDGEWRTFTGALELPDSAPADAVYRFVIAAPGPGWLVIERALLFPADHVEGCDPDVIRLLKESRLPVLRWPGGNFVSGYQWEDGIGPRDRRPTRLNPAWGGVEPNLFGTDEFVAFCRAAGCEPMICVNAGDGTPEEAARWVEYCNGAADTPMGRLRAENGHPEPFRVAHWEVGNELWGQWQVHWTTPAGNVDRYHRFASAMRAADPTIELYACGAPVLWGREWNEALFRGTAPGLPATTDHPLIGGSVPADTDPMAVYRDFMGVPVVLERRWREMERRMVETGIREPALAVTELQLFARITPAGEGKEVRLTRENLVTPATHAEAVYDLLYYHAMARLAPFGRFVTHSATVNHGGGLRKQKERVFPNPCHHAQALFAEFAGATPVHASLSCAAESMPVVLGDIIAAKEGGDYPVLDVLAAIGRDGALLLSLVHRGSTGLLDVEIDLGGFRAAPEARVTTLSAPYPWTANTLERPDAVSPATSTARVEGDRLKVSMAAWSISILRITAE